MKFGAGVTVVGVVATIPMWIIANQEGDNLLGDQFSGGALILLGYAVILTGICMLIAGWRRRRNG